MNITKTVKVGAQIYDVKIVNIIDKGKTAAKVIYNQNIILLARFVIIEKVKIKVSKQSMEGVFNHEIFHIDNWHFNNNIMKESSVDRMANGWHCIEVDNPKIFQKQKGKK